VSWQILAEVGWGIPTLSDMSFRSFQIWYDNKELFPMKLIEMQVIGAMRPPDGSSKTLSGKPLKFPDC